METGRVEQLRAAIDRLSDADVVGLSQRDEIVALWRERARLDAQLARRVAEFDTAVEWSVDGSRSTASWLVRNLRLATGEAHHQVRVARQMAQMPIANAAWQAGRISSRHVDALTAVRHAVDADAEFAAYEATLVDVALKGRPEDVAKGCAVATSAITAPTTRACRRSNAPTPSSTSAGTTSTIRTAVRTVRI